MITQDGKFYFYLCHALFGALQAYYNFLTDDTILHWSSEYEEVQSWLAEEVLVPNEIESFPDDFHLQLQRSGEDLADQSFSLFANKVSLAKGQYDYIVFCMWICRSDSIADRDKIKV